MVGRWQGDPAGSSSTTAPASIAPLGLLLAADLIPDVFSTVGNVTGELTVTRPVARGEAKESTP